jgi:serine/threonine-protein kinase
LFGFDAAMQDQLVSKYKILEIITEGSMGKVFKGIDLLLEREVAIKSLYLEYASRPDIVERFSREAKALAMLHHPNIVNVYDFFRQGDNFFIVTEFVYGETLDEMIAREKAIPWKRAVPLFCQALKSIGHAHSYGIIGLDHHSGQA